jgi:translation initiation factor IF-2
MEFPKIQSKKLEKKPKVSDTLKKKDKIILQDTISVKELSEKIGIPSTEVMKTFILNGMPVGINSSVDFDTVVLLADEFGVKVEKENVKSDVSAMIE